jgi:hypothetical protein
MPENDREDLDNRIAIARNNIANLTEQAAAASGAGIEESLATRLNEQQARLDELLQKRQALG